MTGRIGLRFMKECLNQKLKSIAAPIATTRHYTSSSSSSSTVKPNPPHSSRKGRLLTGTTIGLVIAGGAYASTVDEATFR
ncbi:putative dihydroorotate dehydrogenase (quinone) [Helianthus annuus]|nr:putative dihydroorotate dehydrogenase (quinone) [Helianthus annuus]